MGSPEVLELGDGGSSAVRPSGEVVTVLDGLRSRYGVSTVVHLEELQERSRDMVRSADLVVLDVGFSSEDEGEYIPPWGGDRLNLSLRPKDLQLIRSVSELSSNVVVVITSGQAVLVEEFVDRVAAILWIGYPGPMGGRALAEILAGDVNPAGRMPSVTPRRAEDYLPEGITLSPWAAGPAVDYPYTHGFKHMWMSGAKPRYPLGWGLSYTTFVYEAPSLRTEESGPLPLLVLRVAVSNTGAYPGIETVQVYGACDTCKRTRLPIVLLGFARAHLFKGARDAVEVRFSARELAIYDERRAMWLLEAGSYSIFAGPCADRDRLQAASFVVPADHEFDYEGPKAPPDIPGVGEQQCGSFQCRRDEDFISHQRRLHAQALVANFVLLAVLLWLLYLLCCCCSWPFRSLYRCCCTGREKKKEEKLKQS